MIPAATREKIYKWYAVANVSDLPLNEGRRVYFGLHEVALFRLPGGFRAVANRCPHKGGPLADGIVAGNSVFCPLHNWKVGLQCGTAKPGAGEADGAGCVQVYPVKVMNSIVFIAFDEVSSERENS
ncbi:MAG: Rieske 2Fe-2S domain-containing protein [Candidatus Omnitrophica bacterium]|nr:Rieske 2Fe-2S domain-containing protein [Candidatus Omnitrophota bacterium]